jgi:hypothetical protein
MCVPGTKVKVLQVGAFNLVGKAGKESWLNFGIIRGRIMQKKYNLAVYIM